MTHKWYIVHAYSGFEKKVAAAISEKAKTKNIENAFSEIIAVSYTHLRAHET